MSDSQSSEFGGDISFYINADRDGRSPGLPLLLSSGRNGLIDIEEPRVAQPKVDDDSVRN